MNRRPLRSFAEPDLPPEFVQRRADAYEALRRVKWTRALKEREALCKDTGVENWVTLQLPPTTGALVAPATAVQSFLQLAWIFCRGLDFSPRMIAETTTSRGTRRAKSRNCSSSGCCPG